MSKNILTYYSKKAVRRLEFILELIGNWELRCKEMEKIRMSREDDRLFAPSTLCLEYEL